jgi:hypothetical protein
MTPDIILATGLAPAERIKLVPALPWIGIAIS